MVAEKLLGGMSIKKLSKDHPKIKKIVTKKMVIRKNMVRRRKITTSRRNIKKTVYTSGKEKTSSEIFPEKGISLPVSKISGEKSITWPQAILVFVTFLLVFIFVARFIMGKSGMFGLSTGLKTGETEIKSIYSVGEEKQIKEMQRGKEEKKSPDNSQVLSPEERGDQGGVEIEEVKPPLIVILNGAGVQGRAMELKKKLEENGVIVNKTANAENFHYLNTIIKYPVEKLRQALKLKDVFDILNLKYSLKESFDVDEITVIIGKDNS